VQLSGQPGQLPSEPLRLERDGQRVSGTDHWLPWQKDRRLGELEGQLEAAGIARVVYRFSQEGQLSDARLTILFDDRQATIRWDPTDPPDQPMPLVQLPSRPCGALKPVPSR
jgi:hypothetical protein